MVGKYLAKGEDGGLCFFVSYLEGIQLLLPMKFEGFSLLHQVHNVQEFLHVYRWLVRRTLAQCTLRCGPHPLHEFDLHQKPFSSARPLLGGAEKSLEKFLVPPFPVHQ